jgi:excisionase family DNA binding protein
MLNPSNHTSTAQPLALRVDDAARACGLSRGTLYKLLNRGALRSLKIGNRRLILREDLVSLLESRVARGLN